MRYTSRWLTALATGLLALPLALATGCGPGSSTGRVTGEQAGGPGAGSVAAATPTPAATTAMPSRNPAPATGAPPEGGVRGAVSMQRTGGIAGVMQSVEITADGSWTYTDRKTGTVRRGKLTPVQRQRLTSSLSDPALAREASSQSGGVCSDGFVYSIVSGPLRVRYTSCGGIGNHPAVMAVIRAIEDATPM